jgi:hypothetical protein
VSVEPLEPLVEVPVLTDALVSVDPLEPLVEVLVSTEALVEPLEVPTSTDALVEPLVSTEAVVEPAGRELVSRAWAIPGRTPPRRAAAPRIARHRRTHRRRPCRRLQLKNPLRPNDLSGSCTHRPPSTGQASCLPFWRIYPLKRSPNSPTRRGEKPERANDAAACRASADVTSRTVLTSLSKQRPRNESNRLEQYSEIRRGQARPERPSLPAVGGSDLRWSRSTSIAISGGIAPGGCVLKFVAGAMSSLLSMHPCDPEAARRGPPQKHAKADRIVRWNVEGRRGPTLLVACRPARPARVRTP